MHHLDYDYLIGELISSNVLNRSAARMILLSLQESAVNPLGDAFYAGVNDAQGAAILDVVAEIGGPDALAMLRNVFDFEDHRPDLQVCAAMGLLENYQNLSVDEIWHVKNFLRDYTNQAGAN